MTDQEAIDERWRGLDAETCRDAVITIALIVRDSKIGGVWHPGWLCVFDMPQSNVRPISINGLIGLGLLRHLRDWNGKIELPIKAAAVYAFDFI